jgi:hypothetical protein
MTQKICTGKDVEKDSVKRILSFSNKRREEILGCARKYERIENLKSLIL